MNVDQGKRKARHSRAGRILPGRCTPSGATPGSWPQCAAAKTPLGERAGEAFHRAAPVWGSTGSSSIRPDALAAAAGDSRGCRSSRADDLHRGNAWHGSGRTGNRRDGNSAPGPSFLRDAYILSCGFPPIESGCSRFEHMQRKASGCM